MARKALRAAQGCEQASLPAGPYDPSHPVVPEIPVVGEFAAWGLWQALLEYCGALPGSGTRSRQLWQRITSEKQLLERYWALRETECLTNEHEVSIQPELPMLS